MSRRTGTEPTSGKLAATVPDWLPPFLAAAACVVLLNVALWEQGRRARRRDWEHRLLRELRAWDGRIPEELDRPRKQSG